MAWRYQFCGILHIGGTKYASKSALSLKHSLVRALRPLGTRGQCAGLHSGLIYNDQWRGATNFAVYFTLAVRQQVGTVTQTSSSAAPRPLETIHWARKLSRGLIVLVVKCYLSPVLFDNFFLVMGK